MKFLAIHLPQFHPIPENDEWWGRGFTEWTNTVRARPLFRGHAQPHLPADLGFYDLRLAEARAAQAELAAAHGIDGFCHYHYWFHGRRVLERPVNEILASGQPAFPFCLFWANETWEGRWHGVTEGQRTLIRQDYSVEDDLAHIRWLAQAFADPRYVRIEGRPLFLIYRPRSMPDAARTLERWRHETTRLGLPEPFFMASNSHAYLEDLHAAGFDGVLQFVPQLGVLDCFRPPGLRHRLRRLLLNAREGVLSASLHVYDYERAVRSMLLDPDWPVFRSMIPSWDNSPRAGRRGVVLHHGTPAAFEALLEDVCARTERDLPASRHLVFLNAWNEWAEGNHLEPDQRFGRAWLEAVRRVKDRREAAGAKPGAPALSSSALRAAPSPAPGARTPSTRGADDATLGASAATARSGIRR